MNTKEELLEAFNTVSKLSASPHSNSRFKLVRESQAKIFKELRPAILQTQDSTDTQKLTETLIALSKPGQPFHDIYLFARDLTAGRISNPDTLSLKDWRATRFFVQKAWFDSFADRVSELVIGFKKNLSKYTPKKVAQYLKGSINTLVSHAFAGGVVDEMTHDGTRKPEDILVIRIPLPGACSECLRLFTEGGTPRVFTLKELLENGEDPLRKPGERLPCTGPLHPNCRCLLAEIYPGVDPRIARHDAPGTPRDFSKLLATLTKETL